MSSMNPTATFGMDDKPPRTVILVVEGDFLTRWNVSEYLRETGFEVIEAVSAAEAMSAIQARPTIDAIFLSADAIAGAGASEFVRCLEDRHGTLPVLIATEGADPGSALTLKPTRGEVGKPYALGEVEQKLRELLAHR
jgi:DNA-binding NtrC family response regulator